MKIWHYALAIGITLTTAKNMSGMMETTKKEYSQKPLTKEEKEREELLQRLMEADVDSNEFLGYSTETLFVKFHLLLKSQIIKRDLLRIYGSPTDR